ncbi:hypothetical protein [Streptomyces sp. NPDC013181]|uniref:hypothetical protein n=1 Tax=Streptomyces sp. NPDC013181 TaxID=3364864 RepID=UPI00368B2988
MDDQLVDDAYLGWRTSLETLLGDAPSLARWQERRYRFAHRVGALLTEAQGDAAAVAGPVLYGVYLSGVGLSYVGQTQKAGRRLRDLPVGESHHLANTVPPELWERVVVLRWPLLLPEAPEGDRSEVEKAGHQACGLALEHALQDETAPPLNSRRRDKDGAWRPRNVTGSQSRGARLAQAIPGLKELALEKWRELEQVKPSTGSLVEVTEFGRVVFPSALHGTPES